MTKRTEQALPVKKNDILTLRAEDLTREGAGVCRVDGYTVFVEGLLAGESARVRIVQTRKQYGFGKVLEIVSPSADRVEPDCPYYPRCGGCTLRHLSYEKQLETKAREVWQILGRIGGIRLPEPPPVIGMSEEERICYRNKTQYPVQNVDGELTYGFYARRSHRLIPVEQCRIDSEEASRILPLIADFCRQHGISAYEEESGKGMLRHILIRTGDPGEILVCLVVNGNGIPDEPEMWQMLEQAGVKSFSINRNTERTNVILGRKTRIAGGREYIYASIGEMRYRISAGSFFQVNPAGVRKLYDKVLEYAQLSGKEVVWDAYCGIGTISLFLARKARQVYGAEIFPAAVEDARANAKDNGTDNVEFFLGKAEEILPELARDPKYKPDVIVVDPPRAGCELPLLETVAALRPSRFIYVSCDPGTLARDLKYLTEQGMQVEKIYCVDMFCFTGGIETVVSLRS